MLACLTNRCYLCANISQCATEIGMKLPLNPLRSYIAVLYEVGYKFKSVDAMDLVYDPDTGLYIVDLSPLSPYTLNAYSRHSYFILIVDVTGTGGTPPVDAECSAEVLSCNGVDYDGIELKLVTNPGYNQIVCCQ